MTAEPFALAAEPDHPSISARIPSGWTAEIRDELCGRFKNAIDPDGCRWYLVDGEWRLNVPYFRASRPGLDLDGIAIVSTIDGSREYPITKAGTIIIGRRRIPRAKWIH